MNWKLLLIALSLAVGISARPAEDVESTVSVATITDKVVPEVTKSTIERISTTTEAVTSRKLTTLAPVTETALPTVRYLIANMPTKPTNARKKYANNYANLITKYTLNNIRITSSSDGNNASSNNSNMLAIHDFVVDSSLPVATVASSATTSNSSSKPLVFIDHFDTNPTVADPTITTRRAFVPMDAGTWSNYNLEKPKIVPTRKKKPVIHKIISKWSDNPNEFYNLHSDSPISTQNTVINSLKDNLMQSAFSPGIITAESFGFDQLPALLGQQLFSQQTTYRPPTPAINIIQLYKKRPASVDAPKNNCRRVKINLKNKIGNKNEMASKEICDDVDINVNNDIKNVNTQQAKPATTTADYEFNNDKFEDSASNSDYESSEKQENIDTESPIIVNSITEITRPVNTVGSLKIGDKDKKKKKKKPSLASQIGIDEDEEEGGIGGIGGIGGMGGEGEGGIGTMMVTMMTMMAVFNPLNFGVWGIVMAPMAAMLFGGICYGMYQYMHHDHGSKHGWPAVPWPALPKPQEIIIRNKINHSPIPIKVMHLHKHARPPPFIVSGESYGPPMTPYKSPPKSYGEPVEIHGPIMMSEPPKSYGEPPVDSYQPSAPSGGPYKRKSNVRRFKPLPGPSTNSYKFKLL